jgi:hypothetical protein
MKSKSTTLALFGILLLAAATARSAVPPALSAVLAEKGCVEIAEDSELLRIRNRWWFPLQRFTGSSSDFIFFCQTKSDPLSTQLVIHAKGRNPWSSCDQTIESWKERSKPWLPLDLEVVATSARYSRMSDLGRWRVVRKPIGAPEVYGPAGVPVPDLAIDTSGQDNGSVFVCYSGKWYRHGVD